MSANPSIGDRFEDLVAQGKVKIAAEFIDGHTLSKLFHYISQTVGGGNLLFNEAGIRFSESNKGVTLLNCFSIEACNLTFYHYAHDLPVFCFGFTSSDLRNITKLTKKNESLRLFFHVDYPHLIIDHVSPKKEAGGGGYSFVSPVSLELFEYDVDGYSRGEQDANCTTTVTEFVDWAKHVLSIKASVINIEAHHKGFLFNSCFGGGKIGNSRPFGVIGRSPESGAAPLSPATPSVSEPGAFIPPLTPSLSEASTETSDSHPQISIIPDTVKALTHIRGIGSAKAILRMYMEDETPLKIVVKIGNYGELKIYLWDYRTKRAAPAGATRA